MMRCPCLSRKKVAPTASLEEEVRLANINWVDDTEFDISSQLKFTESMDQPQTYSPEEDIITATGLALVALLDNQTSKLVTLKTKSPLLLNPSILVKENDNNVYGTVKCLIHNATVKGVVAYLFNVESRLSDKYERNPHLVVKKTCAILNPHQLIFHYRGRFPRPLHDRDFVSSFVWKQLSPTQFLVVAVPTIHASVPFFDDVVRGENTRVMLLTQVGANIVSYELVFHSDLKGLIPTAVTKAVTVPANIAGAWRIVLCFMNRKELDQLDDGGEDARLIAQLLMDTWGSAKKDAGKRKALLTFFLRTAALRHITTMYPWFPEFMWHIILGLSDAKDQADSSASHLSEGVDPSTSTAVRSPSRQTSLTTPSSSNVLASMKKALVSRRFASASLLSKEIDLASMKALDAVAIATDLAGRLSHNSNQQLVVEEWINAHLAMRQLDAVVPFFFKPFFRVIVKAIYGISLEDQVLHDNSEWVPDGKKDHDSRDEFVGGMKQDQYYSKVELAFIDNGLALLAMKTDKSVKTVPGKQWLLGEL